MRKISKYESATLLISVCSLIFSIFALSNSKKSNVLSKEYNELVIGQTELLINSRITETKNKVIDFSLKIFEDDSLEENSEKKGNFIKVLLSHQESNLNAYDEACAKYLDNKVDKERFKKTYFTEIREIVENKELKDFFDPTTTRYKTILKVYREWFDLEN